MSVTYTHLCVTCRSALAQPRCPLGHPGSLALAEHDALLDLAWERWPRSHRRPLSFAGWTGALGLTALARGALPVLAATSIAALVAELTGRGRVAPGAAPLGAPPAEAQGVVRALEGASAEHGAEFGPFTGVMAGTATFRHRRGVSLVVGHATVEFAVELNDGRWLYVPAGPLHLVASPTSERYPLRGHEARALLQRVEGKPPRSAFPHDDASVLVLLEGSRVRVHAPLERIPDDDVGYREQAAEGWRCAGWTVLSPGP